MNIYESASKKSFYIVESGMIYFNDEPTTTGAIVSSFNDSHTPEQFDEMIKRHGWTLQEPEVVTVWQITKSDALKAVGVILALAALFVGIMAL
jgi:hypothetical protein|nr:MAG TPA: hypothetical protein [Caudoviricetes sp.]